MTASDPSSSASRIKGERRRAGGPGCGPATANGSREAEEGGAGGRGGGDGRGEIHYTPNQALM